MAVAPGERLRRLAEKWEDRWPEFGAGRAAVVHTYLIALCGVFHNIRLAGWDTGMTDNPLFLPCLDEVISGWINWEHYLDRLEIPLWFALSCQILVDMKWILGRHSPNAFEDLKEHSENQVLLVRKYFGHAISKRRMRTNTTNMPNVLDIPQLVAKCVRKDAYSNAVVGFYRSVSRSGKDLSHFALPPFLVLNHHPLLCGMQAWWIHQRWRLFEEWAVKLHESIIPAALLYMPMRSLGFVTEWPDMEFVRK
ncbi:hypothetical protein F5Y19DRAFT_454017 [Xylariaceae sp. FL1651]|nr:hypothetical protein F5Y19DRAFT_454017 [Xylariaceae sp. FL1651]